MPRPSGLRPPKRIPTGPPKQSRSQLLSDAAFEPEGQSSTQLPLNTSVVSTASRFISADTDDTSVTEPIEDGVATEPSQINQAACNTETPVQLEVELADEAGNTTVEKRSVSADRVAQA